MPFFYGSSKRGVGGGLTATQYDGGDISGNDGLTNRLLTASGTVFQLFVDTQHLHLTTDYTIAANGSTITFLNNIFDSQDITVYTT